MIIVATKILDYINISGTNMAYMPQVVNANNLNQASACSATFELSLRPNKHYTTDRETWMS